MGLLPTPKEDNSASKTFSWHLIMRPESSAVLVHPNAQSNVLSVRAKAMIFADPTSRALLEQVEQFAPSDATVLVIGDTGTGKELVARHLHARSGRSGDFVAVNCGALSQTLAEAELFGHQAGSFTGATQTRAGWFEVANDGTLFLDEIGDLPLALQVKLLRVIQEREVVRVGARAPIPLNVRVIAATNLDLAAAVEAGRFRADLYYRLNVVTLKVPPLAERPGDILPLAEHFLRMYSERVGAQQPQLTPDTQAALVRYAWPGNIRELENVVHTALLTARDGVIRPENLRFAVIPGALSAAAPATVPVTGLDGIAALLCQLLAAQEPDLHARLEELIVRETFTVSGQNQVRSAKLLGITRNNLRTLLKRYRLIS
jgi:sigma-54 dependent transcriptional regulator